MWLRIKLCLNFMLLTFYKTLILIFFILHLAVSRLYLVQFQKNSSQYILLSKLNIGESDLSFLWIYFRVLFLLFVMRRLWLLLTIRTLCNHQFKFCSVAEWAIHNHVILGNFRIVLVILVLHCLLIIFPFLWQVKICFSNDIIILRTV